MTHRKPSKQLAKEKSTKEKSLETSKKPSKQDPTTKPASEQKIVETKIAIGADGVEDFDIDSLDPNCCNVDPKVTLFGVFQVGWTTVDVGSDTYQVYDYYSRAHIM